MFYALDESGKRVSAKYATKDQEYMCPVCRGKVLFRNGGVNSAHFAHENDACEDDWHYDMSEWHKTMQEYFPEENRECVISMGDKCHRADVLVEKTVIEMQHSPISAEEFSDRNQFFRQAGYRVVWVFDVRDKVASRQIELLDITNNYKFKWNNPMRIFHTIPYKLSDYNKDLSIYLDMEVDEDDDENNRECKISKVVWTISDDCHFVNLSRFAVSSHYVNLNDLESVDDFFTAAHETRKKRNDSYRQKLKEKGIDYSVKYIGKKGNAPIGYKCPRNGQNGKRWTKNEFGLDISGEGACCYCRYCSHIVIDELNGKNQREITCCFPTTVHEIDSDGHPGYECSDVPQIW